LRRRFDGEKNHLEILMDLQVLRPPEKKKDFGRLSVHTFALMFVCMDVHPASP
jgi:hypothetical protein